MVKTNSPQTLPQYIGWLKNAYKKPWLYDTDEYVRIKKELYQAKKLKKILEDEDKSLRGFGYQRKPVPKVDIIETVEDVVDYTPGDEVKLVDVEVMESTDV